VRGAKAHTSGGVVCEELIVIAQRAMREDDRDYAVAFAIPVDTAGITLVARGINMPADAQQAPLSHSGAVVESLTIFDDVFVPNERIFLCGESEFCGDVANNFATINRHGYLGTDYGKLELFIGAAALIAEYNGVADKSHIRDKITEMIKLASGIYALGIAAAMKNTIVNGVAFPDAVMTNAGKASDHGGSLHLRSPTQRSRRWRRRDHAIVKGPEESRSGSVYREVFQGSSRDLRDRSGQAVPFHWRFVLLGICGMVV